MTETNPIVALCVDGLSAEAEGRLADAQRSFEHAWSLSTDDFERCIAAHYLARRQATAEAELHWNEEALRRANAAADDRVRAFYPSLYLNFAHSLERLGRVVEACRYYALAAARLDELPASPHGNLVRIGVESGRARTCGANLEP